MNKLNFKDNLSLFFNIGVSIIIIQLGIGLVPGLTVWEAITAVTIGTLLGTWVLSHVAKISADNYLGTGPIFEHTFGSHIGSKLLIGINSITIAGWAIMEVIVVRDLLNATLNIPTVITTFVVAFLLYFLCSRDVVVNIKKLIAKYITPAMYIGMIWMTFVAISNLWSMDMLELWSKMTATTGDMPFWLAMDIAFAIPLSWAPIISEMTKHSASGKDAFKGSYIGFVVGTIWCLILGIFFASIHPGSAATAIVAAVQAGFILACIISITELDNAYSNALSSIEQNTTIFKKMSSKISAFLTTALILIVALIVDITWLEPFLLFVGAITVPAFGVILLHFLLKIHNIKAAFVAWLIGAAAYQAVVIGIPEIGATLPSLLISALAYWLGSKIAR